jgi:hypothetical protein
VNPVFFVKVEMSMLDAPSTDGRTGNSALPPGNDRVAVSVSFVES